MTGAASSTSLPPPAMITSLPESPLIGCHQSAANDIVTLAGRDLVIAVAPSTLSLRRRQRAGHHHPAGDHIVAGVALDVVVAGVTGNLIGTLAPEMTSSPLPPPMMSLPSPPLT